MIICIEGPNGVGKTTQAAKLVERLKEEYPQFQIIALSDPDKSDALTREIRELAKRGSFRSEMTRLMLYQAARAELNYNLRNRPKNSIVVLDRYAYSFYVYALDGFLRATGIQTDMAFAAMDSQLSLCGCVEPDVTLLLDEDPAVCFERMRAANEKNGKAADAFEADFAAVKRHKELYGTLLTRRLANAEILHYIGRMVISVDPDADRIWALARTAVDQWMKMKETIEDGKDPCTCQTGCCGERTRRRNRGEV